VHPEDETFPGIQVFRVDAGLFFATTEALEERVREFVQADPSLTCVVIDLEGADFVDAQGAAKLGEILDLAERWSIVIRLTRLKPNVRAVLDRDGLVDRVGRDHIHGNVDAAVEAELASV
jgi:MFS superfamily sulfate permease-like transporter